MSTYNSFEGTITFKTQQDFDRFVERATRGGYISPTTKKWVDELGNECTNTELVIKERKITFGGNYRNLGRLIGDNFNKEYSFEGTLWWDCLDGCYEMGMISQDEYIYWDMDEYANKVGLPEIDEDEHPENYMDQVTDIIDAFQENPHATPNTVKFVTEEN